MKSRKSFSALMRVEFTSASIADMLTVINDSGIVLKDITPKNDLVIEATINRLDFVRLKKLLDKRGESAKIIRRQGFLWLLSTVRKRLVLVAGIAIIILLSMYLPTRILFVNIKGNSTVSTKQITQTAQRVGIYFGASRRTVRSERIKNALLAELPNLQWVGVNTYGCVVEISVEERTSDVKVNDSTGVSSIIASCNGVIKEMTVTRGNALCKVGQAVSAGQMLVSGYTDCGITIKATNAQAEIYAQTSHELEAITPTHCDMRVRVNSEENRFYLIFGKNIIKLFKDSGISSTSCVKMYEEYYLTLPGGYQLPVAFARERLVYYTGQTECIDDISSYSWLNRQADDYICAHMNAGSILSNNSTTMLWGDVIHLWGRYACYEMIGQVHKEEIYRNND